jgi:hypothetical protein
MTDTVKAAPVFYTRDKEDYKGTKVALWANERTAEEGKKPAQFRGNIGKAAVQLWEGTGGRGVFYNVKTTDGEGKLVQIGNANAFVNPRGFNALSISLRFDTEQAANDAKASLELNEAIKPYTKDGKTSYFINIYADVSRKAIEANTAEFERLGFKTVFEPKAA